MTRAPARGHAAYRRLCAAVVISEAGDWLLFIALPLYVLRLSGSALDTSTVFLAELIPGVIIGTVCGPWLDRGRPGRLLVTLTSAQAILLVPLLFVGPGRLWLIYLVAGIQAAATSLTLPAQQALVPAVVAPSELSRANAVVEMASNAARLVGSPLGGALLPVLGLKALVLGDMLSFVASAGLLAACARAASYAAPGQLPPVAAAVGPEAVADEPVAGARLRAIGQGWRAIRHARTLRAALVISFLAAVAQGLFLVLFVLFVLRLLHAGDQVVGLLRGVQAIGGVLGGIVVAAFAARLRPRALAVGGLTAFGLVSLLTWNSPAVTHATWWYAALFIAVGVPPPRWPRGCSAVPRPRPDRACADASSAFCRLPRRSGRGRAFCSPVCSPVTCRSGCCSTCRRAAIWPARSSR